MTPVVSRDSGGLSAVQEQGPGTAIKVQHGCLAKMDNGSQFRCSACRGGGYNYMVSWRTVCNTNNTETYPANQLVHFFFGSLYVCQIMELPKCVL